VNRDQHHNSSAEHGLDKLLNRLAAGCSDPLVRDWAGRLLAGDSADAPHHSVLNRTAKVLESSA
jgi:hypothetical protein